MGLKVVLIQSFMDALRGTLGEGFNWSASNAIVMAADADVPWGLVAEVRRSKRKLQILNRLANNPASASELASEFNLETGSVSNIFRELKNTDPPLITCLTPDQPHHRLYGLTDLGEEVLEHA